MAVCRAENADYARRLGAAEVIDYTADDVIETVRSRYPEGIDAVADMVGDKGGLARLAEQVRPGGHVASVVGAADREALGGRGIEATNVMGLVATRSLEVLSRMLEVAEIITPEIRSFPLADAVEALAAVGTGHVRGKLVVVVG
jgi:NADPH2:quinone reductase